MLSLKIMALKECFDAFTEALSSFSEQFLSDALPLLLPSETESTRPEALRAFTEIDRPFVGTHTTIAGLACASIATVEKAHQLNHTKDHFQNAIQEIREMKTGEKSRIDKLIDRILQKEGRRTEELTRALECMNLKRLDLLRCYAKIRILPPKLQSFSWTWAKTHSSIVQVSREEALEMAIHLPHPDTKALVIELLNQIDDHEKLAMKKTLPNQMRANIVFEENGVLVRQPMTLSGIALCQDVTLPKIKWRENPADTESPTQPRRIRDDRVIEPEPFIKALRLHRYVN